LLLFIGLGALAACWALIKAAVGFMKGEPMVIRGIALKKSNQPDLFGLIAEVAAKLKSHLPDHVVVGLEPNFFVTAADVKLVPSGEVLKGKTLFVSLGLLRTLTKAELTAVIGHEFGHFRGDDVAYSLKFAPTYTRLGQAITKLGDTAGNASDIGKLPALVALSICLSEFASAERSVGRERELLADKAGAQAADATSLATALVKVSLYAGQWGTVTNALTDEIVKGNTFTNLAQVYANLCQNTVTQIDWPAARDILGQNVQSHPVDTHPSLLARLQGLSTSLFDITPEALFLPEAPASNLIHEAEQMETALSDFEARWLVAIGAVIPPTRTSE
jgi:Zn-dependent protease with chaperone function